ncbi:MAG TPA: hypothetical protein VL361_19385 [Candidatus Limnocylindrales bacterium]|nr:hypothetical protein [Candidatus Limnocylindrales bacterium]
MNNFKIANDVARLCARRLGTGYRSRGERWRIGRSVTLVMCFLLLFLSQNAFGASEETTFKALQVGDRTYQNVKVTTKAKSFIIIQHSGGITSIKVSDLPADALEKLGYAPKVPKKRVKTAAMLASIAVPRTEMVIKPVQAKLSEGWHRMAETSNKYVTKVTRTQVIIAAAMAVVGYFWFSYCCLLICQKTGFEPGIWVWLPLVQTLPMLRAACMSPWWSLALLVPGLNLVAYVIWCFKIVEARQKTLPLAILLLLPVTNCLAFMFLAFSNAPSGEKETVAGFVIPQKA